MEKSTNLSDNASRRRKKSSLRPMSVLFWVLSKTISLRPMGRYSLLKIGILRSTKSTTKASSPRRITSLDSKNLRMSAPETTSLDKCLEKTSDLPYKPFGPLLSPKRPMLYYD